MLDCAKHKFAHWRDGRKTMALDLEHSVMRKVAWRLVPFLGLAYFINALDRFNISIAALTMNKALGLSATTYGLGAGAFFWSYVLFQLPANRSEERRVGKECRS